MKKPLDTQLATQQKVRLGAADQNAAKLITLHCTTILITLVCHAHLLDSENHAVTHTFDEHIAGTQKSLSGDATQIKHNGYSD